MTMHFDIASLASIYDRGRLVPFTGSGMSIGECHDWKSFVERLVAHSRIVEPLGASNTEPVRRAAAALESLRRSGSDIGEAVRKSVYVGGAHRVTHNHALARLYWPLLCTTNYDDVYLKEAFSARKTLPRVRGRSEADCRRVMQHLTFPAGELVWAIQGCLAPRTGELAGCMGSDHRSLERELVVGPAEYRQVAHLSPQFRRCFADVFRNRSFLFLGAGLSEPYVLNLFDEIIALGGPPPTPHFALVEEGTVDVDLMRDHYHIICNTFSKGRYADVKTFLDHLADFVLGERVRVHGWSYRAKTPSSVNNEHCSAHFEVRRAPLPLPTAIKDDEVIAISCGRDWATDPLGTPMPGHLFENRVPIEDRDKPTWLNDYTVSWNVKGSVLGIAARHRHDHGESSSRDERSPEAIRLAFMAFLDVVALRKAHTAHVQLLGVGRHRTFWPWVSLVQMARAYGQWSTLRHSVHPLPRAIIYVVAPDIVALLNAGHLQLAEHLQDARMRVSIEVVDAFGEVHSHQEFVDPSARLGTLRVFRSGPPDPIVHALPAPTLRSKPALLNDALRGYELRDFGLVPGSTLVVDYRKSSGGRTHLSDGR